MSARPSTEFSRTEDRRTSTKMGLWMSLVAVVLVMTPSVYRLVNELFHWGDAAMVAAGTALSAFHIARLARVKRAHEKGL